MVSLVSKFWTLCWFLKRPSFWAHAISIAYRKLQKGNDQGPAVTAALDWAKMQSASSRQALVNLALVNPQENPPQLGAAIIAMAEEAVSRANSVKMGGGGDIQLLYAVTLLLRAHRVIETGVAFGWSSMAILAALHEQQAGKLVSVDMPYPKMDYEKWVGLAVPSDFQSRWSVIREPDRFGLGKAISLLGGQIDLCHYDSDKSYAGRRYGYALMWNALRPGGILISDDIEDNLAFRDLVARLKVPFAVIECQGKYVGIVRKS